MTATRLGVLEALRAFRTGALAPADYLRACRARAHELQHQLHAFVHLAASGPEPGEGPLAGIPVGVKDIIATADMPTTNGSPVYAGHRPAEDAAVVARLRGLAATILGKTVTTEFAWRRAGPTVNPWNPGHTPGGSSSGSAAAVAAGAVPLALGTQTLGSIIRPAAFCGVVGLKPSFGTIPREGVHPFAGSLDTVGLFARSVDDAAYALSLLADAPGPGSAIPVSLETGVEPAAAPRLAFVGTRIWNRVEPAQQALLEGAAQRFREAGGTVEDLELPPEFDRMWDLANVLLYGEAGPVFRPLLERHPDLLSEHIRGVVEEARSISSADIEAARAAQRDLREGFTAATRGFDAVLTPPAFGEAPAGLAGTGDAALCTPWTFLGTPAVTLPAGFGPNGLPLGIQLVAPFGRDADLLRVAKWAEGAIGLERRWPMGG